MANQTINDLTTVATVVGTDFMPVWKTASGLTRKVSIVNLLGGVIGNVATLTGNETITGIKTFPNGIIFANETLSAYDEGTWTPVLSDAASAGNVATIGTNYGAFVKVGKIVTVSFRCTSITTAGMTGGNNLNLQSLPFASQNNANFRAFGVVRVENIAFTSYVIAVIGSNVTVATFAEHTTGGASGNITVSDLTSGTAGIQGTITYISGS